MRLASSLFIVALVACGGGSSAKKDTDTKTPSAPARTIAVLEKDKTPAGIPVAVACQVVDENGNTVEAKTAIDPAPDMEVAADKVSSTKVGTYQVTCSLLDATGPYEKVPAQLEVVPSEPATLDIMVDPKADYYAVSDEVSISWTVKDAFGNEVTGLPAKVTVKPEKGLSKTGDKYRFDEDGVYEVTVTLEAPYQNISNSVELICDGSGPVIEITFPERGETFSGDGKVTVKGKVTDKAAGVESVEVNDKEIKLDGDGKFECPIQSMHGINVVVVKARDKANHTSKATRGFYYSTAYVPVKADTKVKDVVVGQGAMAFLGQTVLDDGVHDPAHLDDIATIVEVLLASQDIAALLGNSAVIPPIELPGIINFQLPIPGIQAGLKGDLEVLVQPKDIVIGSPLVGIKCRDGGLAVSVAFSPASMTLDMTFTLSAHLYAVNPVDGKTYDIPLAAPSASTSTGLKVAKIAVTMDLDVNKDPGQPIQVKGKNFNLELQGIEVDPVEQLVFDLGEIDLFGKKVQLGKYDLSQWVGPINDFLAKNVINPVLNFITQPLIDLLEPLITGLVGDALKQVLGLLAIHQTVQLPPVGGGEAVPLEISAELGTVHFTAKGGEVGLDAGVLSQKKVDREPLGSILRAGCGVGDQSVFQFGPAPEAQLGVRNDLINEVLFMVWWSGYLNREFDLSGMLGSNSQLPISDLVVTPTLLLPPILDDCQDRKERIELADAYLDVRFTLIGDQHLGIWLNMKATGGVIASGSKVGIKIEKVDTFEAEITDIAGNLGPLSGMIDSLVPTLLKQIEGKEFTFDVPEIDLGGVVPGLPSGSKITVGNLQAATSAGVVTIGGDLL